MKLLDLYTALRIVRIIEWGGPAALCPYCHEDSSDGHDEECELAELIDALTEAVEREES